MSRLLFILLAAGLAGDSLAQVNPPAQPTRVEPGIADTDPARKGLRSLRTDLRTPSGFENVYRLDSTDAFGRTTSSFMRIDGATYAVFPRSVYVPTRAGLMPQIPPGTVFHIGAPPVPPSEDRPAAGPTLVNLSIDTRVNTAAPAAPPSARTPETAPPPPKKSAAPDAQEPPSIFSSETYRQQRMTDILIGPRRPPGTRDERLANPKR